MNQENLVELFQKIGEVTTLEDIGYHEIVDGRLKPIYKTQTDVLGIEKWKTVHGQNPVFVKETFILREVTEKKQPVYINDTHNDHRSADAFFLFGVDSVLIFPVTQVEEVIGIVCIVSIGKLHEFTEDEVKTCSLLVKEYMQDV